ncbi:MAG: peptidoglycan editing factor PgeF [Clostridia bacterium]|nr:peptidoglycan editing factor PgeF [Clostridia bacterium]
MFVTAPALQACGLRHGFTTRAAGDMKAAESRGRLGSDEHVWHKASQVHGVAVAVACENTVIGSDNTPQADALITDKPGHVLTVFVADCVPVILFDPVAKALAVVHAGWRGTAGGITAASVREICKKYNAKPQNIIAAIGPSIGPCCYEVGPECAAQFPKACINDSMHLDLWLANKLNLLEAGVLQQNIHILQACTSCNPDKYFSHRASGGSGERMAAFAMLPQI